MDKEISIIIPSYNRDRLLRNLLLSFKAQTYKNFNVFVGYQGTNEYFLSLKKLENLVNYSLSIIHFDNNHLTKIKNELIQNSHSNYILTLDDDVIVEKNLLNTFMKNDFDISGGLVIEDQRRSMFEKIYLFYIEKIVNLKPGSFSLAGELNTNFKNSEKGYVQAVKGGNMIFKRKVWEDIGGYDENYSGNAINEDNDFCLQAKKRGYKIYFNKEASVKHLISPGGTRSYGTKQSANWYQDFFRNHIYFFLKNFWHKRGLIKIVSLVCFVLYRARQIFTCLVKYGKLRPKYIKSFYKGVSEGLSLYKKYVITDDES